MGFEDDLLANWTRDTLEAYGASLRAAGDIRGELIAIDLAIDDASPEVIAALRESKLELQQEWLGEDAGKHIRTRYGYIESTNVDLSEVLRILEIAAPYLKRLQLWGGGSQSTEVLDAFMTGPRPWLSSIEVNGYGDNATLIPSDVLARLAAVTPNLHRFEARGHYVLDEIPHPGITHLVVDGHDAIGALRGHGTMPNVTTLDVALHHDFPIYREPSPDILRSGFVRRSAFPRLHTLDVSRNEPRGRTVDPNCLGGRTPFFDVLNRLEILPHVVKLRIPSVRTDAQCEQLQNIVARMPALEELEVARMYNDIALHVRHEARLTVPPAVPWPPGDEIRDYDALLFEIAGEWCRVGLDDAYEVNELYYANMSAHHRAAWDAMWTLAASLLHSDQAVALMSRAQLDDLFASYEDVHSEFYTWREMKKKLDAAPPQDPLNVRRINGYEKPYVPPAQPVREAITSDRILEHERALQAAWDLDRLAVYADDLLELGDVRGELIQLDLEIAAGKGRTEAAYRRDEIHDEIFGTDYVVKSKFGLALVDVSSWSEDRLGRVFVGDTARYVRELEISGPSEGVDRDLSVAIAEPRPWLHRVLVETMGEREGATTTLDPEKLVAVWPYLQTFELVADNYGSPFDGFAHPGVTKLKITGTTAFSQFGAPWPAVIELDFAYGVEQFGGANVVISRERLPALRVLDLSRNEPASDAMERDRFHCSLRDLFPTVNGYDILPQLVELRLPSPRDAEDVNQMQLMLDKMPALERFEIARRYPDGPSVALRHPTAKLVVPAPCTWMPADQVGEYDSITVEGAQFPIVRASLAMERHYDKLATQYQLAWDELWAILRADRRQFPFSATKLYGAVEALQKADDYAFDDVCEKLMAALHAPAIAEATVQVRIEPEA